MISVRSEVRVFPGPPAPPDFCRHLGAIAQLGERVLCKHEVVGSIPSGSTRWLIEALSSRSYPGFEPCSSSTTVSQLSQESCGLSDIVKRKYIRLPREGSGEMRVSSDYSSARICSRQASIPVSGRSMTAALPGVFEANWSFYRCSRQ